MFELLLYFMFMLLTQVPIFAINICLKVLYQYSLDSVFYI